LSTVYNQGLSNKGLRMGRGKDRCPQCGGKKIVILNNIKKCKVCKYEWTGKSRKKTTKKEKIRF